MKTILLLAAAAATTLALATSGGAQTPTTIKLTQKDRFFHFVDVPPKKGDSKPTGGDEFVIRGALSRDGAADGAGTNVCVYTTKGEAECNGTLALKDGSIMLSGVLDFTAKSNTGAVTGGTGAYAGARGTVVIGNSSSGDTAPIEVTLSA